jgi:hypothetical protein
MKREPFFAFIMLGFVLPLVGLAQADEIQVYDGGLAPVGKFNLTLHDNFTPDGLKVAAIPNGIIPDKSLNGVAEWAYGVNRWFEAGLYMPLYSIAKNGGATFNGFKLRTLFAVPDADNRTFVYGVNFEFSFNSKRWDTNRFTSEIRPIVGWHLQPLDIFFNPILDTAYDGFGNLVFVPNIRIAHNFSARWALGVEEYAEYGPLRDFFPRSDQAHQLYAVVDRVTRFADVEFGVGFGLTKGSDKLTLKLILSRDLN